MDIKESIGDLIRDKRTKKGCTQEQLSSEAGVSNRFLQDIEAGEKMASMSEGEEWASRSLLEVFNNEEVQRSSDHKLAERDVAASIYNLRKQLQMEDYKRIFDKRNRFIGEDN